MVEHAGGDVRQRVGENGETEPSGRTVLEAAERLDLDLQHVGLVELRGVAPVVETREVGGVEQ